MNNLNDSISMIAFGIVFIIFSKQLVYIFGILEWKLWKVFIHDDSESFKKMFVTKNSVVLRVAGFVMIFAAIANYILRKLI